MYLCTCVWSRVHLYIAKNKGFRSCETKFMYSSYMCMYVCMHAYICSYIGKHACLYVYVWVCVHGTENKGIMMWMWFDIHAHIHESLLCHCMYMDTHCVSKWVYTCAHTHMHTYIHTYIHTCTTGCVCELRGCTYNSSYSIWRRRFSLTHLHAW